MPCRVRLVRRRRARCQGVIAEDRRLEPCPALRKVPYRQVRPRRGRLPASHHTRQGVMRRVEVIEHLVHCGRGHGPVGVLLRGTQPGCREGFILRGGHRCPQAVLAGRGFGVVREEAALRVAVGGGHRRAPCRGEEARQGQADRVVVRTEHPGLYHAASPNALPQGPPQEGLVDQQGVHPVPERVERGGHVLLAARRGPPENAGLPARAEVLRGRVGGGIHVDVGVTCDDHQLSPNEAACRGIGVPGEGIGMVGRCSPASRPTNRPTIPNASLPGDGMMYPHPPAYQGMPPQAHVQQRLQAGGIAWGAQEGKGEEHRRAWERKGEAERSLREREARVMGGAGRAAEWRTEGTGRPQGGEAQAVEQLQRAWADLRVRQEGVERAEREGGRQEDGRGQEGRPPLVPFRQPAIPPEQEG